ncbi:MAG: caspase family protein [Bacteroidia bacterium]
MKTKLLFLFLVLFSSVKAQTSKLYFFYIIQTDEGIGSTTDKANMLSLVSEICKSTKQEAVNVEIASVSATLSELKKVVSRYSITESDVLWVYYSGHGENYDTWPQTDEGELPLSEVHTWLKSQKAGLTIAMYDCCTWREPLIKRKSSEYSTCSFNFYKPLFLNSKGHLKIASCSSTQFSFGSKGAGSIFTNNFIDAIRSQASWKEVLNAAKVGTESMAKAYNREQNPQFRVEQ